MRYVYLGDRLTPARLRGMPCDPVRRADGRCAVGRRLASALVVDALGRRHVVARRRLRLAPAGSAGSPAAGGPAAGSPARPLAGSEQGERTPGAP